MSINARTAADATTTDATATAALVGLLQRYPEYVTVSGMPLLWCGWNGVYRRVWSKLRDTPQLKNGRPVYRLASHTLTFIPILGMDIEYDGSRWTMRRECDEDVWMVQSSSPDHDGGGGPNGSYRATTMTGFAPTNVKVTLGDNSVSWWSSALATAAFAVGGAVAYAMFAAAS